MKKIMFAVVAALAMASCGGNNAAQTETTEAPEVCEEAVGFDVETLAEAIKTGDKEVIADALTQAQVEIAKLVSEDKCCDARSLADAVEVALAENVEALDAAGVDYTGIAAAVEAVKSVETCEKACEKACEEAN